MGLREYTYFFYSLIRASLGQGLWAMVHDDDDDDDDQLVRLSFQPFIFSQPAVFFSHNKSANSIFNHLFSAQANRLDVVLRRWV
jgi:hypothetical protein